MEHIHLHIVDHIACVCVRCLIKCKSIYCFIWQYLLQYDLFLFIDFPSRIETFGFAFPPPEVPIVSFFFIALSWRWDLRCIEKHCWRSSGGKKISPIDGRIDRNWLQLQITLEHCKDIQTRIIHNIEMKFHWLTLRKCLNCKCSQQWYKRREHKKKTPINSVFYLCQRSTVKVYTNRSSN